MRREVLLLSLSAYCASSTAASAEVKFHSTSVFGKTLQAGKVEFFGGIPYAEPPIDNLRFRLPVLKSKLATSIFNATEFGPACLQPAGFWGAIPNSSEDCLSINIYRPSGAPTRQRLPVMVFIHGGGFLTGAGSPYDGSNLVVKSVDRGTPIIYASINYRLGPLGYPQGSEVAADRVLNLGSKDQLAALKWIQKNIHHFGGDPEKVTAFGQSAGAVSINLLYFSGLEEYVRGAILESGTAGTTYTFPPSRRQSTWDAFVAAIPECSNSKGNDSLSCLRRVKDSSAILKAIGLSIDASGEFFPFVPTIDGPGGILPDLPSKLFEKGKFSRVPFIAGGNFDEATPFVSMAVSTEQQVREVISANYTANADRTPTPELDVAINKLLELYPDDPALGSPFNTGNETFGLSSQFKRAAAVVGDLMFHSVRRLWTQSAVKAGVKAYGYHFTGPRLPYPISFPPAFGVQHGAELQYVFGNNPASNDPFPNGSQPDVALSDAMMDYWISFAATGDPNDGKGAKRPHWPQYGTRNTNILELNSRKINVVSDEYRADGIGFMNENPALFGH